MRSWNLSYEVLMQQQQRGSGAILLITRSACRGGRGEVGGVCKKPLKLCALRCASVGSPSHPARGSLPQRSPRDDIGSEAEHEGADEGADLPGGSLPSPLLLLQATLTDTVDTERLGSVGETKGRPKLCNYPVFMIINVGFGFCKERIPCEAVTICTFCLRTCDPPGNHRIQSGGAN